MNSIENRPQSKNFTLEQANASLPLVRAIAGDWIRLSREVIECKERLDWLIGNRRLQKGDFYGEELLETERELARDIQQVNEYVEELRALGVEPQPGGMVGFPSNLDGSPIFLSWKYNEPEVLYWYEQQENSLNRKPLYRGRTGSSPNTSDGSLFSTS